MGKSSRSRPLSQRSPKPISYSRYCGAAPAREDPDRLQGRRGDAAHAVLGGTMKERNEIKITDMEWRGK